MFRIHTLMTWKPIVLLALPSCLKALISGCIRLINATSACLLPVISNLICQRKQKENIKILLKLLNKTCLRNRTKLRFDILHSFMVCAQTSAFWYTESWDYRILNCACGKQKWSGYREKLHFYWLVRFVLKIVKKIKKIIPEDYEGKFLCCWRNHQQNVPPISHGTILRCTSYGW